MTPLSACTGPENCPEMLYAFPFFFAAVWVLACFSLSRMSGWTLLAERYALETMRPDGRMPEGEELRWQSGSFKKKIPTNYNGCLNFNIGPDGLGLQVMLIFSYRHKPLLIPWGDIALSEKRSWGMKMTVLEFGDTGVTLSLFRKPLVDKILAAHASYGGARR